MHVKDESLYILEQITDLLNLINNDQYVKVTESLTGNYIGRHIQHVIEFYDVFVNCYYTGTVDYYSKKHDKSIGKDRERAIEKVHLIKEGIKEITSDFAITMCMTHPVFGFKRDFVPSSVKRELRFNLEHAINHLLIIKRAIKASFPEIELPDNFGDLKKMDVSNISSA
ncbi:hypothetical protein [Chondrinema litorale]|uniref:hypothetical protein n=1 Tax=Chondrinema litorale TaxID=2994555 RepID=UPI002542869E|nr:hypothetical protein [Chondrinema litorale]UZR94995.1 hypothetical protein OQ292_04095 [Chondrinema litorale]